MNEVSQIEMNNGRAVWPAFVAATFTLLLWSGTAIANKFAVMHMDALSAGILRSMIAGSLALVIALVLRLPFPARGKDRLLLLISGVTSFAVWPMLLSLGIGRTTAGHAAVIMAMIPILTVLIASVIARKVPALLWWIGAGIALVATMTLIGNRQYASVDSSAWGDMVVLFGCLSCASGYVAGGTLSPKIGTAATTFWGLSMALMVLIPSFLLVYARTDWATVPFEAWAGIAWMAFMSSLTGYALWFFALGRAGIERISTLQLAMPVLTLVAAALLLDETLSLFIGLVCVAVVVGTWLAQRNAN
ncbi:MAG: O-acetylserine/cysteine efflux transporter [Lysobacterales bacterium]